MHPLRLFILLLLFIAPAAQAVGTDIIVYPRPLSDSDTRFEYHLSLLREALERTIDEYGPFELRPTNVKMNQLRQFDLLQSGSPGLDITIKPTSIQRERVLTPIRIPLEKGLLGWRIMLIHRLNQQLIARTRSLRDLQHFMFGQGLGWSDVAILRANGLKVMEGAQYEGLFKMVVSGRFDIFLRGVNEAFAEWDERHEELPDLHVEETLLLHYPFARYFWTANTERGKRLRERITKGLEAMIADGSFDARFRKHYGEILSRVHCEDRTLINLKNPWFPPATPLDRKELWFSPFEE